MADWRQPEDIDDDNVLITSVGYVCKETKANVTLAMDLSEDGDTHGRSKIPVAMIVSREIIWGQGEDK